MTKPGLILLGLLCLNHAALAAPAPLFASDETLQISLQGPFSRINRERNREREYEGSLRYRDASGAEIVLDARFEVRGNWRLQRENCRNAPLWVDLRRSQLAETVFAGQNRLKLVLPCGRQTRYADYLHKERQAYELFELLSDQALDVRKLQVDLFDSEGGAERSEAGFFIEHHRRLAARLGLEEEEANQVEIASLDPLQRTLVSLFMYLLGNTDYSLIQGPPGEECCHNSKLLRSPQGTLFPVPYDFDASGFVDASYAPEPNPRFRIRNNRQRHFRGLCVDAATVGLAVARYQEVRPRVMALLADDPEVSPRQTGRSLAYVEEFYEILDAPERVQSLFIDDCREWQ